MLNPKTESESINSTGSPEKMRGWRSSGKEPYVFRANRPGDFDISFDGNSLKDLEALARFLARNMRAERQKCSL